MGYKDSVSHADRVSPLRTLERQEGILIVTTRQDERWKKGISACWLIKTVAIEKWAGKIRFYRKNGIRRGREKNELKKRTKIMRKRDRDDYLYSQPHSNSAQSPEIVPVEDRKKSWFISFIVVNKIFFFDSLNFKLNIYGEPINVPFQYF